MSTRSIALSLVIAGDSFGREVVGALDELLPSLPDVYGFCVRTDTSGNPETLSRLRSELCQLENTERIKDLGYTALGSDVGSLRVHVYFVGALEEDALTSPMLEAVAQEHPEDLISCVCLGADGSAPVKEKLRALCGDAARPYLVAPSAGGHELARDTLVGGVAGFVFASISHRVDEAGFPDPECVFTLGFAGKIGLTTDARTQLARHTSLKLVKLQRELVEHPARVDSRQALDEWLARFSPHRLGDDLFVPENAGVPERERIPAVVKWVPDELGDSLVVQLDRAAVALELDEKRPETWVDAIRKFSRVFDMSRAVRWKGMLERAHDTVREHVQSTMLEQFRSVVGEMVQPLGACRAALIELRSRIERGVRSEATPDRDLDQALDDLRGAVERLPDPLALFLKMALWVVPALVIGVGLFDLFYAGLRGVVFPVLYAALLLAVGVGWPLVLITRARRALYRARDVAIDVMVSRQEGIISENAVGYLKETLVVALGEIDPAEAVLDAHGEDLEAAETALEEAVAAEMPSPLTLEPVITSFEEFRRVHDGLGVDSKDWLVAAVGEGCFDVVDADGRVGTVVGWCATRISDENIVQLPDFRALWEIRADCRGAGSLEDAVREVWRRAAPFAGGATRSEIGLFLCTSDLHEDVRSVVSESGAFGECTVEVSEDAPILACLRLGSLGPE